MLGNTVVVAQHVGIHATAGLVALGIPFGQQLLVFRGFFTRGILFFFDFGGLGLEFQFRSLHIFFAGLGIDHQFQNFVLVAANFLLGKLDFLQKRAVLIIGLYGQRLVAIFGDFLLQVGDGRVVLAAGGFVSLDGFLALGQLGFCSGEFFFDNSDFFRQGGYFFLQPLDFLVGNLQINQALYVRRHG